MRITWYGHAAFLIETQGLRIILDPYRSPDSGGYLPIDEPADLVIVSHENDRYHSHLGQIVPPFEVARALELPEGGHEFNGLHIQAIHVFETPERRPDDEVTIVHLEAEGLRLVFLGDLGHPLTEADLAPLRGADIVLAAAGGPPTIDFPEIPALLDAIGPRLVLPMHYKTPKINLNIQPLERFLEALAKDPVVRAGSSSLEITRDSLPEQRTIVVLEHAR
jgi:L-ascorbate metabolism protein UlaG (beta-lactamase superfamily)